MKPIKIYKDLKIGPSYFVVDWMLHDRCTYDCSYCPPANKSGSDSWLNLSTITEFCEKLEGHVQRVNPASKIHCWFTGGEPTVWKDFSKLVDILLARGWHLSVNSNGSRSTRWWEENARKFSRITLSYHTEGVTDDEFIEKVKICERHTRTSVNVMLNPNDVWFRKALRFSQRLKEETINADIVHHQIQYNFGLQEIKVAPYTDEHLSIIPTLKDRWLKGKDTVDDNYVLQLADGTVKRCNGIELINNKQANFWGWKCSVGLDSVFIDARGDISRGTCRVNGSFGNILHPNNIQWPANPVKCPYQWCGCIADILSEKTAP
jgi:MoaA/NifB/PqqE/SkfB family radical SAM enzyme